MTISIAKLLKLILSLTIAVSVVACNSRTVQRTVHDGSIDTDAKPLETDESSEQAERAEKLPDFGKNEAKSSTTSSVDLKKMRAYVLDEKLITDPRGYNIEQITTNLDIFNREILRQIEENNSAENSELNSILDQYEDLLLRGIEKNIQSYFKYFRNSSRSAEVYGHIIERRWLKQGAALATKDLLRDYRLLATLMFDLGNKNHSPFLQGLYLSKSIAYTTALQEGGPDLVKELQRHINFTSQMLDEVNLVIKSECKRNQELKQVECLSPDDLKLYRLVQKFLDTINVWSISKTDSAGVIELKNKLVKLSREFMRDESGNITDSLQKEIANSQKDSDSFLNLVLMLKTNLGEKALLELGLDVNKFVSSDNKPKAEFFNIFFFTIYGKSV